VGSSANRFALCVAVAVAAGCSQTTGLNPGHLPEAGQLASRPVQFARRLVGPGSVLTSHSGGPIIGWAIDENGTDGVLTEVTRISTPYRSIVETFDQATAQIVKVVREQNSGPKGNRELAVRGILADDVGLIDDELRHEGKTFRDVYDVMVPVTGNSISGTWKQPPGKDFLLYDIADQQSNPVSVMTATILDGVISKPPTFEVVVTDVETNKVLRILHAPRGDGVDYPYLVAEDTSLNKAYVPAASYSSNPIFIAYDVNTGKAASFLGPSFGPIDGMAIDSTTHVLCTTTHSDYSVEFYDLKGGKQISEVALPNAGGEQEAGYSIAADPINHLFLVEQPLSSVSSGSTIYVYDESGSLQETLNGFAFGDYSGIQITAATRSGYVAGPRANQLQSFTY
jgi:hypothetical protein